jgi:hypothetical protein
MSGLEMRILLLLISCALIAHGALLSGIFRLRGGLVPQPSEDGEYYEKFKIDYGCNDNVRIAGSMRGLIRSGKLMSLPHADPFIRWLNEKLEKGPQPPGGRVKPFYVSASLVIFITQNNCATVLFTWYRLRILERRRI